uniref:Uncharacterized protein n=1 Tax=Anguilla anguilla TaxID=7936 RepID=A0A0E9VCN2_ANGAN
MEHSVPALDLPLIPILKFPQTYISVQLPKCTAEEAGSESTCLTVQHIFCPNIYFINIQSTI